MGKLNQHDVHERYQVLASVLRLQCEIGYAPNVREIGVGASTSVTARHLHHLREDGFLAGDYRTNRGLYAPVIGEAWVDGQRRLVTAL